MDTCELDSAIQTKGKIRLLSPIGGDLSKLGSIGSIKSLNIYIIQSDNSCPAIRQIFIYDSLVLTICYVSIKNLINHKQGIFLLINNGTKSQQKSCRDHLNSISTTKVFELPCIPDDIHFFKNYVYLFARIFICTGESSQKNE